MSTGVPGDPRVLPSLHPPRVQPWHASVPIGTPLSSPPLPPSALRTPTLSERKDYPLLVGKRALGGKAAVSWCW